MKKLIYACGLGLLLIALNFSLFAQDNQAKTDDFNKIAKLTKSKKPEDREKAFQLSKEFVKKYGTGTDDDQLKKIKLYIENFQYDQFNKLMDAGKTAEAFAFGAEILAQQPENSYITFNLAYAGFDANSKNKVKTYDAQAINYAKETLKLFEAGKLPVRFSPFKDQTEVTALMYYIMGSLLVETDLENSVANFYKSLQYDAQFKTKTYPYTILIYYLEQKFKKAEQDYTLKHGAKRVEDAAMKADAEKVEKILKNLLDVYTRAIKYGEAEKNPSVTTWKQNFSQIYQFINKSNAGEAEFLATQPDKPLPDPTAN